MYRVLSVEDDTALRFVYSKMKTWAECEFTIAAQASDGRQALSILQKESFDLIFTDIRMPFMDGIELLKAMRDEMNISTPVIFASSYNDFEYARQGLVLGAFDYLLKPVDEKKLKDVLSRVSERLRQEAGAKIDDVLTGLLAQLEVPLEDELVHQVAEYCCAHYRDNLSGDDFAEMYGYHKDYFSKVFRQHFRMSPREFCTRVKIAYAADLLRAGTYKIYEVSDMLGFSSYRYFNEKFREITGVAPSSYKPGYDTWKEGAADGVRGDPDR